MNKKKLGLHYKNRHKEGYILSELCKEDADLVKHVFKNKRGIDTIDFSNSTAVKTLNKVLLKKHYHIKYWEFPDDNLCPPIPGRVDYIHHLADLLKTSGLNDNVRVFDIGTGATCIYPLLGNSEYHWKFIASDIDKNSIANANNIINKNGLTEAIQLRFQKDKTQIFKDVITPSDKVAASICNPPFYKSEKEAQEATSRKWKGLGKTNIKERNFSGTHNELWYQGGEKAFVHNYLYQSSLVKAQCFWFTTLVSKKENLKSMYASLNKLGAVEVKTIEMNNGNKVTRIVAWTFLNKKEQNQWNNKL